MQKITVRVFKVNEILGVVAGTMLMLLLPIVKERPLHRNLKNATFSNKNERLNV